MTVEWSKSRLARASRSLVFFGLLYLYLWLAVEPQLIYSCGTVTNFPVFYKDWPFLRECLSYPGGLLRYVFALLPQFFYYSWAGAFVITGQAWAISAGTAGFFGPLACPVGRAPIRAGASCPRRVRAVQLSLSDDRRGPGFAAVWVSLHCDRFAREEGIRRVCRARHLLRERGFVWGPGASHPQGRRP